MERAASFDFDADRVASASVVEPAPTPKRRGRPPGNGGNNRKRLAAAGVPVDDRERTREGRQRKPGGLAIPERLRDGPGQPLAWPAYEEFARHVAGGLPERDAWRMAGYTSFADYLKVARDPIFLERVEELRARYLEQSTLSPGYLQSRLLQLTTSDVGDYIERVPHSPNRWRAKDLMSLPREVRQCISEVTIDAKTGNLNFKLHDKAAALRDLARIAAPMRHEMTGRNGAPVQIEAMLTPENVARLSDEELAALKQLTAKLVSAGPVVEGEAEAVDDDEDGAS